MRTSSRPSQSNRFLLEMNIISPRHLLQGYLGVRRVVLPSPPHPLVVLHLAEVRLSHGGSGPGSLEDTVLIRALVHWQRSGSGLATKKQDLWPCLPPSLGFGTGGARSGGSDSESPGPAGVVVRCVVNGLLSTQKSPNFVLASLFCLFQLYIP